MSYTYPEALNAMETIATDLLKASWPNVSFTVSVRADTQSGTASVDWQGNPRKGSYVRVHIRMPVRPATYRMTADEFRHWAAYLLHEVGHPNETDMDVWKQAVYSKRSNLLNALEDVREEKCTIDRGIAVNALKVLSELIDMLQAKAVAGGYDPNSVHSIGWTISALARHANGYAVDVSHITENLDPNGIVGRIVPWALAELSQTTSTQDCLDLSEKIILAVRAAQAEEPKVEEPKVEEPEAEEPEAGEVGGETQDAPKGAGSGSDIPEDDKPLPEAPAGDESKAEEPKADEPKAGDIVTRGQPAEGKDDGKLFSDDDIEPVDLAPNGLENMTSTNPDARTQQRLTSMLRAVIRREAQSPEKVIYGRDKFGSVAMVTKNASKMGRQRAQLAAVLKANDIDSYDTGRAHGRLNRRALAKIANGNTNVFGKRVVTEGYDTDVQILVDGSSSMSGSAIMAAASLALVVAQAASQVGVNCTAHVFNDRGLHCSTKGRERPKANRFAYMLNQVMGGTPLTENLLRAAHMQNERAGFRRRILFVITDGECNHGGEMVKAAGNYIERTMGAEIANLHIGSEVMGLFRNEIAVNPRKVTEAGLRQLVGVLAKGAA